ncbi:MAG: hypothetical protein DMG61_10540 [Acidobacteria bacterium]|nr:MAG: hypothetical protein DMG61_10540 [Acidobacteriota bacterium]
MKKLLCRVAVTGCLGLGLFLTAQNLTQTTTTAIPSPSQTLASLATLDLDTLITEDLATIDTSTTTTNSPGDPSQPTHFPPSGNFKLIGPAKDDIDPQNPYNEVISFDTTNPLAVPMAFRAFGDHVKIHWFTDMIEMKYYFVGRSCGGGSPRIVLLVDADGDGKFNQSSGDFAANGHVNPPSTVGCRMNQWVYEDLTDTGNRWEITPGGAVPDLLLNRFPYFTWNELITAVNADFPNHRILAGFLVEDSQSFFPADQGCAYYDLLSIGPHPLSDHSDTSNGNKEPNNC